MSMPEAAWESRWINTEYACCFVGFFDFATENGDIVPAFCGYAQLGKFMDEWWLDYLVPIFGHWQQGPVSPTAERGKILFRELMAVKGFELSPRLPARAATTHGLIVVPATAHVATKAIGTERRRVLL